MCTLATLYSLYYRSQMKIWRARCGRRARRWWWTGRRGKGWSSMGGRSCWERNNSVNMNRLSFIRTQHRMSRHPQHLLEYHWGGLGQQAELQRGGGTRLLLRLVDEGLETTVGGDCRGRQCRLLYFFEEVNRNKDYHCIIIIIVLQQPFKFKLFYNLYLK